MNKRSSIVFIIILILLLSACSKQEKSEQATDEQLIIHTTLYPLEYIIKQIGKEAIIVDTIFPPGVDAHTYEPASKEITNLATGDAFVYLGAGMEGFAETAASALANQDVQLIEIGKHEELFMEANEEEHDHDDHHHSDLDPHIWLDPLKMIEIGQIIMDELILLNPELETNFNDNFINFEQDMKELHESFAETLSAKEQKQILVTHAAYGYLESRYGIEQLSISGLSTTDEPSQKQLAEIARTADELKIKFVIFEQGTANKTAEIIQDHIGAEKLFMHNLEVLTEADIEHEEDYLSLMENNLRVLDKATK